MFTENDVRETARRVVTLSRGQMSRIAGAAPDHRPLDSRNPYLDLFALLFRFARNPAADAGAIPGQIEVARSILDNPLYAGAEGTAESPLLQAVVQGAEARLRKLRGCTLSPDEEDLLK